MTQFTDDDDYICVVSQFVLFVFTSSQLSPPLSTCSSPNSANPDQTFHNFSQGLSSTGKVELKKRKMQVFFVSFYISNVRSGSWWRQYTILLYRRRIIATTNFLCTSFGCPTNEGNIIIVLLLLSLLLPLPTKPSKRTAKRGKKPAIHIGRNAVRVLKLRIEG